MLFECHTLDRCITTIFLSGFPFSGRTARLPYDTECLENFGPEVRERFQRIFQMEGPVPQQNNTEFFPQFQDRGSQLEDDNGRSLGRIERNGGRPTKRLRVSRTISS